MTDTNSTNPYTDPSYQGEMQRNLDDKIRSEAQAKPANPPVATTDYVVKDPQVEKMQARGIDPYKAPPPMSSVYPGMMPPMYPGMMPGMMPPMMPGMPPVDMSQFGPYADPGYRENSQIQKMFPGFVQPNPSHAQNGPPINRPPPIQNRSPPSQYGPGYGNPYPGGGYPAQQQPQHQGQYPPPGYGYPTGPSNQG